MFGHIVEALKARAVASRAYANRLRKIATHGSVHAAIDRQLRDVDEVERWLFTEESATSASVVKACFERLVLVTTTLEKINRLLQPPPRGHGPNSQLLE